MYFVGLQEQDNMTYQARVEALRRRFGQETDTSIALQELAGLKRGKNQSAKELANSAICLASRTYYSNDYASQEKCTEQGCRTLEMAVEIVEIQEQYTKRAVRAVRTEEYEVTTYLKVMGEKLEALLGEIKDDQDQRKQWAARRKSTRQ